MSSKLFFAPIPLLVGGWMFTSSFTVSTIMQPTTPYSTQQQSVEVEMPEPAKSFLRIGGAVLAVAAPSSLVFWELTSKKRHLTQPPQLLLKASQNVSNQQSQPSSFGVDNTQPKVKSVASTHTDINRVDTSYQQTNSPPVPKQVPNFYQTGAYESINSGNKVDAERRMSGAINEDKYGDIKSLVYENTVGIVGKEKGSGKTSKLGYLIAEHIKLGHLVWMVNPFAKGQHWKGIKVFGRGYNFVEATNAIREFTRIAFFRIAEAGDETKEYEPFEDIHIHLSLDEMSNYSSEVDNIDATVMPKFWEAVVQFVRQSNMSVSFASHGDTQAMLGGAKALAGKSETIKDAIVWLYAQAVTDRNIEGNKRCAGWAYLIRPDGGERQKLRVDIPTWMQGPPATRLDGKDKYNYVQLVQKYCPQFLYLPTNAQQPTSDPVDTEQFRLKLIEQEDIWGLDSEPN